jgi:GNAT superfamily N-acetyltransferase
MVTPMNVRNAVPEDRERVVDVLTRAFRGDAIVRYLFQNDTTYPDRAALFFGHYFDVRIAGGEVFVYGDDVAGAALWNPPGGNRLGREFVEDHWNRTVVAAADHEEIERYEAFSAVLAAMTPSEPHWYLGLLGTDPERQRGGVARALLLPMLARAHREGVPVFLETGMPGNLQVYARFGFEPIAETTVPEGPKVWGMLRKAALV